MAACIYSSAGVSGSATLLDNIGTCAGRLRKFPVDHFQLSHDIHGFACCRLRPSRSLFRALIARPSRGERFAFSRGADCVAIGTLGQQTDRFVPATSRPCFGPTVPRNSKHRPQNRLITTPGCTCFFCRITRIPHIVSELPPSVGPGIRPSRERTTGGTQQHRQQLRAGQGSR